MSIVIGVFSAKGGVGKSLIATNLGVVLGLGNQYRTVVIDLNRGLGTADLLLDLKPERTWEDLLVVIGELTAQHLKLVATRYQLGMDLLACPRTFSWKQVLTEKDLSSMLSAIRKQYDVIILDTAAGGGQVNWKAFSLADVRLIVITPDLPALQATSRYLDTAPKEEKITGLVINQYTTGAAVNPEEIREYFRESVISVLPMDSSGVWENISFGKPCVLHKNNPLGKALRKLSVKIIRVFEHKNLETNNEIL
ncbi:MAG: AAA family ATPase [Anaerolineales bacterium]